MEKYLYLTKVEWTEAWISGGKIPISLASTYLSQDRSGTKTPDENFVYDSPVDLKIFRPGINVPDAANVRGLTITRSYYNGARLPEVINANHYREDGLILSFCNEFSDEIASRLGKSACIKILDVEKLRRKIDKQLGCRGEMNDCLYTPGHQRGHFLKHIDDSWQREFRIFWRTLNEKWVTVPKDTAVFVKSY